MELKFDELKIAAAILCERNEKPVEDIVKEYWEIYDALREKMKMPGTMASGEPIE